MKFIPLRDNVLVRADKATDETTKSGIVLSQAVKEWTAHPHFGMVLEVGPKVGEVKVGDKVRFNRYAFEKVGEDDFLGLERNITAIVKVEDEV